MGTRSGGRSEGACSKGSTESAWKRTAESDENCTESSTTATPRNTSSRTVSTMGGGGSRAQRERVDETKLTHVGEQLLRMSCELEPFSQLTTRFDMHRPHTSSCDDRFGCGSYILDLHEIIQFALQQVLPQNDRSTDRKNSLCEANTSAMSRISYKASPELSIYESAASTTRPFF